MGIHLEKPNYQFIVITSLVKAGISSAELIGKDDIRIEDNRISIRLPKSTITEFIIEDNDSSSYNYPDMDIDPLHWKLITDLVRPEIKRECCKKESLKRLPKGWKTFFHHFFTKQVLNSWSLSENKFFFSAVFSQPGISSFKFRKKMVDIRRSVNRGFFKLRGFFRYFLDIHIGTASLY